MGQCADASQRPTSRRQHDLIPKMTRKYLSSHCVLCMRPNQHSRFRFQSPDVAAVCADFFDRLGCIFLCTELTVGRPCAWTRPVATLSECYSLTRHDGQTDGRTSRFVIMSATTRRDDCLDMIRLFADRQNNGLIAALITTLQTTVPADGIDRRQTDSQPPIAARCYA